MNSTIELVFMIASVMMICIIFISVYGFRKERGVSYLLGVIMCRIVYASGVVLEKSSDLLIEKLIFRNMFQTALNLMVPFFLLFTLELIGRDKLLRTRWKIMLFSGFTLWSLLMWFDADLHMIYRTIELYDGHLVTTRTVYSITFSIICYCIVLICFYFLVQYIRNIRNDLRKPVLWVLLLASFSFVFEIVKFASPGWLPWLLPLTVYCGFIGMVMLVIILRYKFFSIVPFARNMVLDTLQESILIANAAGQVIDSNKQASQWFSKMGYASVSGRSIAELLALWPQWHMLCKSMQQGNVEIDIWLDGERRNYSVNVYPLHTQRKQRQGSISLIFDITEKERHLEQIVQLNQLKDQLLTIVSHDIRSPLALQFQLVELLEEDRDSFGAEHREIIERLGDQTRNTLGMTTNLLEWFRIQREDMSLRPQILELSEVVEDCCHLLRIQSESKQIMVSNRIASGTRVYADREALGLIIRNLLSNAIKFTGLCGSIQVYAQVSGDMVIVSVRDNGVGMEEEHVRQLFGEKQHNSLMGTMGEKGTGLGLLVSQQFVQRSGGSLWVESKAGQGSVFHFTIKGEHNDGNTHR
ncbi:sensor histidine kinase [Paenibacillus eucommiae]|uniref:histidine kinase n=1 Tax=Paenibacillus eucommiae TaxID=1355755 RepID=A0ABS4J7Y0_9BACL|nr:ATP-binding protein [Paenibacillus eucommiae]MBP1994859.1 signal transduction histidine kinase [Paenibacillus eucommiae]